MTNILFLIKALIYDHNKRYNKAVFFYDKIKNKNKFIYYRMGTNLLKKQSYAEAEKNLKLAIKKGNKKSICFYRLGLALEKQEKKEEAAAFFKKAIEARKNWIPWIEHYLNCHNINEINDKFDLSILNAIEKSSPIYWEKKAIEAIKNKKYFIAVINYKHCIDFEPTKNSYWYELAKCYDKLGEYLKAINCYKKSNLLGINSKFLHYHLGICLEKNNNIEESKIEFQKACKICKFDDKYGSALLDKSEGNWQRVAKSLIEYTENHQNEDEFAHYTLAMALDYCYEWEQAIEQLELAINLSPKENSDWFCRLGTLYERVGQKRKACSAYYTSLQIKNCTETNFRLGLCLMSIYDYDSACSYFEKSYLGVKNIKNKKINELKNLFFKNHFNKNIVWSLGYEFASYCMYKEAAEIYSQIYSIKPIVPFGISSKTYMTKQFIKIATYLAFLKQQICNNFILYESFLGNTMSCNPYAIFEYLYSNKNYNNFIHIWCINDEQVIPNKYKNKYNIVFVKRDSMEYVKYIAISKYLINNVSFPAWFIKRNEQIYCNIWHGTPLKKLGSSNKFDPYGYGNVTRNFLQASFIIHPNNYTEKIILNEYHIRNILPGKSIVSGYPRQDNLLNMSLPQKNELKKEILNINSKKKILLYAPTWRDYSTIEMQIEKTKRVVTALQKTDFYIIFKGHQFIEKYFRESGLPVVPPDIDTNKLLSIVDTLVTDYSSIGIDFLVTKKPIYYLMDDYDIYREKRGLYINKENIPGFVCNNINDLITEINKKTPCKTLTNFQKSLISKDDGLATERVVSLLFNHEDKIKTASKSKPIDKKNILFYAGTLLKNGIFSSFISLVEKIKSKFNIFIIVDSQQLCEPEKVQLLNKLPKGINIIPRSEYFLKSHEDEFCLNKYAMYKKIKNKNFITVLKNIYTREFTRIFGQSKFDSVINFEGYNYFYTNLFAFAEQNNKIIFLHNDMYSEKKEKYPYLECNFNLFKFYNRIISVSKETSRLNQINLSNFYDIGHQKFDFLNNMINHKKIISLSKQPIPNNELKYFINGPIFINAARFSPEKDHLKLIRAFKLVIQKNYNAKLILLGTGPLLSEVYRLILKLKLSNNIFLLGQKENPYPYFSKSNCFVLSSNHEGQPMVLLEAIALSLPIISTDIPATHDLLFGTNAILCKNTESDLSKSIINVCNRLPNKVQFNFNEYNDTCINKFLNII